MHRDWCGRECAECKERCDLDEILLCSPDCEHLGPDGEFSDGCKNCDAYIAYIERDETFIDRLMRRRENELD